MFLTKSRFITMLRAWNVCGYLSLFFLEMDCILYKWRLKWCPLLWYIWLINSYKIRWFWWRLIGSMIATITVSNLMIRKLYRVSQPLCARKRQYWVTYLRPRHNLSWIQTVTLLNKSICRCAILETSINCVEHSLSCLFGFILFVLHYVGGWRHHFWI